MRDNKKYSIEEVDKAKTRVLKYIIYKRRTENEIRRKFENDFEEELLNECIDYLKEAGYIDDDEYIERTVDGFTKLKNLSIKEIKYKLIAKGLRGDLIEDYLYENKDKLNDYEIKSAQNIIIKRKRDYGEIEIKQYLMKKGYKIDNINKAFEYNII